ncbi:hypothetical protein WR25_09559 [Diploscapter pachys]|uniref:Uncharacterized protein n=1 Tax=Diploscapter pachys TaxID=2018661 RepID=A0A2A2KX29_9BILA|nr:hypothetical protein WR25_09559 [Diploscapter pachys]
MDELRAGPSNVPSVPPVTSAASGSASSDDSTEPMTAAGETESLINPAQIALLQHQLDEHTHSSSSASFSSISNQSDEKDAKEMYRLLSANRKFDKTVRILKRLKTTGVIDNYA